MISGNGSWALLHRQDITDLRDGSLYIRRWKVVSTPLAGVYLHALHRPDNDRHLHTHPWPFVSLILRGGYTEVVPGRFGSTEWHNQYEDPFYGLRGGLRARLRCMVNISPRRRIHKIEWLWRKPTWTLVFHGRRKGDWGFLVDDEIVPVEIYLEEKLWL